MARRGKVWYDRGGEGHFQIDGRDVTREEYDAAFPSKIHQLLDGGAAPATAHPAGWPMQSMALACTPRQVAAMTERNRKHGITGVSYDPSGLCHVASPGEFQKLQRLEGVHQLNNPRGPGV